MATLIFKNAFFSINGVDLSDHVDNIQINYEAEMQDDAVMGNNTRTEKAGLLNWSMSISLKQDFAAGEVDATLFSLVGATPPTVIVRPDAGAVSATNPQFSGLCNVRSYPIFGNAVGDLAVTTIELGPAGDLTRATA